MDEKTHKIIQDLKKVRMSAEDKSRVRNLLATEMQANPTEAPVASPYAPKYFAWSVFMHSKTFVSVAICLIILIGSSSLVLGSQNSLPGESLYYVKTKVSEPLQRVLQTESGVSSIDFETSLIEKRLVEAEQLDQKGTLDASAKIQLKDEISKQEKRVENAVNIFVNKNTNDEKKNNDPANQTQINTQINMSAISPQADTDNEESKENTTPPQNTMMLRAVEPDKKTDKTQATTTESTSTANSKSYKSLNLNLKGKFTAKQKGSSKEVDSAIKRMDEIVKKHQKVLEKIDN